MGLDLVLASAALLWVAVEASLVHRPGAVATLGYLRFGFAAALAATFTSFWVMPWAQIPKPWTSFVKVFVALSCFAITGGYAWMLRRIRRRADAESSPAR